MTPGHAVLDKQSKREWFYTDPHEAELLLQPEVDYSRGKAMYELIPEACHQWVCNNINSNHTRLPHYRRHYVSMSLCFISVATHF